MARASHPGHIVLVDVLRSFSGAVTAPIACLKFAGFLLTAWAIRSHILLPVRASARHKVCLRGTSPQVRWTHGSVLVKQDFSGAATPGSI